MPVSVCAAQAPKAGGSTAKKEGSLSLWRVDRDQLTDMSQIRVSLYLLLLIRGL